MAALQQPDSFAPCVLLMDEVEKFFEIIIELPRLTHKAIGIDSHRANRDGGRAEGATHNRNLCCAPRTSSAQQTSIPLLVFRMVATMLGNCFLSAAAVYLMADVGERQQVAALGQIGLR